MVATERGRVDITGLHSAFDPLAQLFISYGREMLTYRLIDDAIGRFVVGFPFGPRYLRAIAMVGGQPLLATYDLAEREWSAGATPLTFTRPADVLERMRCTYPEAFGHAGRA